MARRAIRVRDADGAVVGVVTVPRADVLRHWRTSARIAWFCALEGCDGAGSAGSEQEAQAVLRVHLAGAHRIDLSRLTWS